jgi:AraC-like DNA-binding protein/quercetin dioxygenase-like cupin family protein
MRPGADWNRRARVIMHPERRGVAGVSLFGRYNYVSAHPALPDHVHSRDIEICYLARGRQTYCVGGETCRLRGGDVFLTFPGERHSTGGEPEEKGVLYWLTLRVPLRADRAFLGLPPTMSRSLLGSLLGVRRRHFRGTRRMKELLDAAARYYHRATPALADVRIANAIQAFLLELIDAAGETSSRARGRSVDGIVVAVRAQPGADWAVPRMAAVAGLSTPRFKARFKEEIGIPPHEFVLRTRVEEAVRRLEQGRTTITQIALDLGFSSSQYFATVYKRFTGTTPRARRSMATRARAS